MTNNHIFDEQALIIELESNKDLLEAFFRKRSDIRVWDDIKALLNIIFEAESNNKLYIQFHQGIIKNHHTGHPVFRDKALVEWERRAALLRKLARKHGSQSKAVIEDFFHKQWQ